MTASVSGGEEPPFVSCLMPFGDPRRIKLAGKAIQHFVNQIYAPKQLVIANSSGTRLLSKPHPAIREIDLGKRRFAVGELRTEALRKSNGNWIALWDDDDYYGPYYLVYHAANRRLGYSSLLTSQVRFNYRTGTAYMHHKPDGIYSTIFCPKTEAEFPAADQGDVEGFWIEHWAMRTHVVRNDLYPADCLSLAVHHGLNLTPAEQFMEFHDGPAHTGIWELGDNEARLVRNVLVSMYGVSFQEQREGDDLTVERAPGGPEHRQD